MPVPVCGHQEVCRLRKLGPVPKIRGALRANTGRCTVELAEEQPLEARFRRITLDILREAVEAFLVDHAVPLEAGVEEVETARRIELELGSKIGFVGDHARGTLVLSPSSDVLERSHPVDANALDDHADGMEDWVGEMANQVFGRVKNRLLAHGVEMLCDTPMAVSGKLRIGGPRRAATRVDFEGAHGSLAVWLDMQVDDDLVLQEVSSQEVRAEGDVVLF